MGKQEQSSSAVEDCRRQCVGGVSVALGRRRSTLNFICRLTVIANSSKCLHIITYTDKKIYIVLCFIIIYINIEVNMNSMSIRTKNCNAFLLSLDKVGLQCMLTHIES